MDGRTAGWASEGSHGHSLEPSLLPTLLGLHITAWDALRLFPCLLWSLLAIVCAVVFLQYPIVHGRPAHLLPMLGALQSAMPSFMCSCLILMYHRERILLFGLPRETAKSFSGFYCILSALGCLVYLTLLMTTVFVFQVDRTEEPAYFFLSSSWLLVTILCSQQQQQKQQQQQQEQLQQLQLRQQEQLERLLLQRQQQQLQKEQKQHQEVLQQEVLQQDMLLLQQQLQKEQQQQEELLHQELLQYEMLPQEQQQQELQELLLQQQQQQQQQQLQQQQQQQQQR
ncbi:hypothetical protein, conserved [Eimeria acervulina]|uniref:Uncharacterized protein n=1 Tax=Eimeria acervulina TaxID=5801 RepID=U6G8Q6_EIMAC|nr:hypothetical protein, conserved [Eimeria acervulina]CDI76631.1 hypothetical protein, conserved [Eimeria acervulina]